MAGTLSASRRLHNGAAYPRGHACPTGSIGDNRFEIGRRPPSLEATTAKAVSAST
jgi:hypothetical protein